ncbi:MAG: hypothetical protein AAF772_07570, partial [Acidobacteriota bacterium]
DAAGRPVDGAQLGLLGARAAVDSPGQVQLDLRLDVDGVAPGDYTMELEVRADGVERTLISRAPVRVVG